MAFDRTVPAPHAELTSQMFRTQYVGLDDKILALPAPPTNLSQLTNDAGFLTAETEPAFNASEAKLLEPGDKAKLDALGTPSTLVDAAQVPQISDARQLLAGDGVTVAATWGDGVLRVGPTGESVATNNGVSARGLGYGQMLIVGGTVAAQWSAGILQDVAGNPFLTAAGAPPVNAADWAGNPPATLAEWFLRVAAKASNNGADPIQLVLR